MHVSLTVRRALVGAATLGLLLTAATQFGVTADGTPANKTAAAGNGLTKVNRDSVILEETVRVSDPTDLILSVTSECSILTSLYTNTAFDADDPDPTTDTDKARGSVFVWVTIDGKPVPVQSTDPDDGIVTFCNRTYQRSVTDNEDPLDGIDDEDDFIRTKNANAFNWLALNVGRDYDVDGDNVVKVEVHADFRRYASDGSDRCKDDTPQGDTCADAYVGKRTLIIEATNAAVGEVVTPTDGEGDTANDTPVPALIG